jgi:hypothetical protein
VVNFCAIADTSVVYVAPCRVLSRLSKLPYRDTEQSRQPNNDLHTSGRRLSSGLLVCHDAGREQSMMDSNLHKRSLRLLLALHRAGQCAQCCRHPIPAPAPRIARAQTSTRKCRFRGSNAAITGAGRNARSRRSRYPASG